MPDVALEVRNVSKKFRRGEIYDSLRDLIPALLKRATGGQTPSGLGAREFWAVNDVSFQVEQGEAFGIIGPNGAGKSTILKILSGILRPTTGDIAVRGRLSALIEVGAGFHPDLTGRENVYLSGAILGMTRVDVRRRFDEIVTFAGLEESIDTPVKRYSSGMFARLGFAVAAHVDPDVLIVDEILSVGDLTFQRRCIERMNYVIHRGATVLFVSHNLQAVADLCQRCALFERGKVLSIGPSADVVRMYTDNMQERRRSNVDAAVIIDSVTPRNADGDVRAFFRSGDNLALEVVIAARQMVEKVGIVIDVYDEKFGAIFNTSSERLGARTLTMQPGETVTVPIGLTLNLAPGTYRIDLRLFRADVGTQYDHWPAAASILVTSDIDVKGVVNLNPVFSPATAIRSAT